MPMVNISKEQCRAARAWLGISQQELATDSGVALSTISRFELGEIMPYDRTLRDIRHAVENAGVELLFEGSLGVGIRVLRATS
jgi:predicted transcriptional regulator